jgi:trimeric autotransporter adhesin
MFRRLLFLRNLVGLFLLSSSPAFANSSTAPVQPQIQTSQIQTSQVQSPASILRISPKIGARFTSQGGGTSSAFGFEGFVPLQQQPGQNLTYVEGRLQIATDNGALGGNVLLGHRFLTESKKAIVGTYLSYDNRNTGNTSFHQLGAGFEHLSDAIDFRFNAYLPVGNSRAELSNRPIGTVRFQGNGLGIDRLQVFQQALAGMDVEIGTKLANLGKGSLRGYIGGYYYGGDNSNFAGFRTRLVAKPSDTIAAGLTVQTDSRFDTRVMFSLGVSFPGSGGGSAPENTSVLARLGESPDRQQSILVDQFNKSSFEAGINPDTGKPWFIQHVIAGTAAGGGTFEAPAGNIAAVLPKARSGGLVYVQAGSNPGMPGFTIPDGVSVVSNVERESIPTQFGNVPLPNSGSGIRPTITGPIILGNDTVLVGFEILNSSGHGIEGKNIRNVTIANNEIFDSKLNGIKLENVTGTVDIIDNLVDNIENNPGNDNPGNNDEPLPQAKVVQVANKESIEPQDGILVTNSTGVTNLTIEGNEITNSSRSGVLVELLGNAQGSVTIADNGVYDNQLFGIVVAPEGKAKATIQITDNDTANNGATQGINILSRDTAQSEVLIDGNRLSRDSILVQSSGSSRVLATVSNNLVTGDALSLTPGIIFSGEDNSVGVGNIRANQVSRFTAPFASGIQTSIANNAKATVTIADNRVTNNQRGIVTNVDDNGKLNTTIAGNEVKGNLNEGVMVTGAATFNKLGTGAPQIAAVLRNNEVTGNQPSELGFGDMAIASFSPNARICFQLTNNQIGILAIGDTSNPLLSLLNPQLGFLGGTVALELPTTYNPLTNTISSGGNTIVGINPATPVAWSSSSIPQGSCK